MANWQQGGGGGGGGNWNAQGGGGGGNNWQGGGNAGGQGGGQQAWQGGGAGGNAGGNWQGGGGGGGNAQGGQQSWQQGGQQGGGQQSWQQQGGGKGGQPAQGGQQSWQQGGQQGQGGQQQSWQQGGKGGGQQQSWGQQGNQGAAAGGNSWGGNNAGGGNASWGGNNAGGGNNASWGGQQQGGQQQGQQAAQASVPASQLVVQGCAHPTIGNIVRGTFTVESENHTKPVYKRDSQVSGLDVMIYYWDERDGPSQAGWWFGPKVGGEQVWAYNPDLKSHGPPRAGWQVPYGGPVDQTFIVQAGSPPAAAGGGGGWGQQGQQSQQQGQQSWSQPQQQAQQTQQSWGNQAQGGQANAWGQGQGQGQAQQQQQQQGWGNQAQAQAQGGQQQAWNQAQQPKPQMQQQQQMQGKGGGQQQPQMQQQQAKGGGYQQPQVQQQQQGKGGGQQAWQIAQQQQQAQKQAQMEEMKKRQEENKKKLEEARAKQQAEQKKKMEEMQRLREEAVKKKQEEEAKKKEEMEAKRLAEEARRLESRATFAIRRIIQKVRVASPESVEQLTKDLEAEIEKELPNCGEQKEKIKEEADRGLEQARARIEKIAEQRKAEEEKKAEIERLKKQKQEKAQAICEQLTELVDKADAEATKLKEAVKGLEMEGATTTKDVEAAFEDVGGAEEACKVACKVCMDLIKEENATMKDPHALVETKQACAKLLNRIQECQKGLDATMTEAKGSKAKALKKAAAQEKQKAVEQLFKKYDKDSDKALSQKEVLAYAKGEFGVKLEKDSIDWIWRSLVAEDGKGVAIDKLSQLTSIVGVSRELARDKQRIADRVEKEKVIGGLRDALKAKVEAAEKVVAMAEKDVIAAENHVHEFYKKARVTSSEEMTSLAGGSFKKLKGVTASYDKAKKEMDACGQGLEKKYEKDLKEHYEKSAKLVNVKMGRMEMRINRLETISRRFKDQAKFKELDGMEKLRIKALKIIHYHQIKNDLSNDEMFDVFSSGKPIDSKAWKAFFETAEKVVRPVKEKSDEPEPEKEEEKKEEKAEEAPAAEEEKKDEEIKEAEEEKKEETEEAENQEDEENLTEEEKKKREMEKKKKQIADKLKAAAEAKKKAEEEVKKKIEAAKKAAAEKKKKAEEEARRKKEEAEIENIEISPEDLGVVFAYLDESSKGHLTKERFSQINRRYMKVVKDTAMTSELGVTGKPVRKLEKGEVVEVFKGPLKGKNEVSRIFCKALNDDLEGWVSVEGNAGTKFLESGGNAYKVIRKSVMTDSFETNGEVDATDSNKLRPGTVLELREFPRKEESSGLTRMKGKVRALDGKTGWVTTAGKDGKVFLRAV